MSRRVSKRTGSPAQRPTPRRRQRPALEIDVELLHRVKAWAARLLREHAGHTREKMAEKAGVGLTTLRDLERGRYNNDNGTLDRVVAKYGYMPSELQRLVERWLRKFQHRTARLRAANPKAVLLYPWGEVVK